MCLRCTGGGTRTREIGEPSADGCGVEVSAPLISKITDKVLEGIADGQARTLDGVCSGGRARSVPSNSYRFYDGTTTWCA
jgi:transposase-like protein